MTDKESTLAVKLYHLGLYDQIEYVYSYGEELLRGFKNITKRGMDKEDE